MTILIFSSGHLSWLRFAWWISTYFCPILHYGRASYRHIFTWPLSPNGWHASSIWYLRDTSFELAQHKLDDEHHLTLINLVSFLLISIDDVLKITMNDHIILFFKTYLRYAQLTYDQSSDNSLNNNLVITYSSSWSYQVYIHNLDDLDAQNFNISIYSWHQ